MSNPTITEQLHLALHELGLLLRASRDTDHQDLQAAANEVIRLVPKFGESPESAGPRYPHDVAAKHWRLAALGQAHLDYSAAMQQMRLDTELNEGRRFFELDRQAAVARAAREALVEALGGAADA